MILRDHMMRLLTCIGQLYGIREYRWRTYAGGDSPGSTDANGDVSLLHFEGDAVENQGAKRNGGCTSEDDIDIVHFLSGYTSRTVVQYHPCCGLGLQITPGHSL